MKKLLLIVLMCLVASASVASPSKGGRAYGKDHGSGNPRMFMCQIFSVYDWKWCRGDWTN